MAQPLQPGLNMCNDDVFTRCSLFTQSAHSVYVRLFPVFFVVRKCKLSDARKMPSMECVLGSGQLTLKKQKKMRPQEP